MKKETINKLQNLEKEIKNFLKHSNEIAMDDIEERIFSNDVDMLKWKLRWKLEDR